MEFTRLRIITEMPMMNKYIHLLRESYYTIYGIASMEVWGFTNYGTNEYHIKSRLERMGGDIANPWSYQESSESDTYKLWWSYYYTVIYQCNMIIDRLPANTIATKSIKDQAIAEARAIRAIMMMYLVQLWGNPPLADHLMIGTEGNTPAEESWAFVETELAAAAEGLPSKSGLNGQSSIGGRLTKEAAYAYLGKAYLWQGKYSEAANTLYDKVIATNLYGLVDDFEELNSFRTDFCKEYLWEYSLTEDPNYQSSQAGAMNAMAVNWGYNVDYPDEVWNGQGYGNGTGYCSESFGAFMDVHDRILPGSIESARYKGTLMPYEGFFDETRWTYSDGTKGIHTNEGNCEGYFRVRLISYKENINYVGSSWYSDLLHKNLCYTRYAEVLLNYAEAVAMGGAPGAMSGLEALNIVRRRAGLTDAPALDMNNETYGVKAERRAELFYEDSRFIDLVRWGDAATVLADVGKRRPRFYGYQDGSTSGPQSKANWKVEFTQTTSPGFVSGKNELMPIPQSDMNSNSNLNQNPNW